MTVILGSNMDAILVDTDEVAEECIEYLREHRIGTATFIPLSTVVTKEVQERLRLASISCHLFQKITTFQTQLASDMLTCYQSHSFYVFLS